MSPEDYCAFLKRDNNLKEENFEFAKKLFEHYQKQADTLDPSLKNIISNFHQLELARSAELSTTERLALTLSKLGQATLALFYTSKEDRTLDRWLQLFPRAERSFLVPAASLILSGRLEPENEERLKALLEKTPIGERSSLLLFVRHSLVTRGVNQHELIARLETDVPAALTHMEEEMSARVNVKSKEAEEAELPSAETKDETGAPFKPSPLRRADSLPDLANLGKVKSKEEAMREKDGELWTCIDREPDQFGGYLYCFKMREGLDPNQFHGDYQAMANAERRSRERIDEIFPAIEPMADDFRNELDVEYAAPRRAELTPDQVRERIREHLEDARRDPFEVGLNSEDKLRFFIKKLDQDVDLKQIAEANIWAQADPSIMDPDRAESSSRLDTLMDETREFVSSLEGGVIRVVEYSKYYPKNESERLSKLAAFKQKLGYATKVDSDGCVIMVLPDREALLARYAKLREMDPSLPEIDIHSGDGIASDMEFLDAYLSHDALLSSGKEFIHDHCFHVMRLFALVFEGASESRYRTEKKRLFQLVLPYYQQIMLAEASGEGSAIPAKELEVLKTTLGGIVDTLSAAQTFNQTNVAEWKTRLQRAPQIWSKTSFRAGEGSWKDYFTKRYEMDKLDLEQLRKGWQLIVEAVGKQISKRKSGQIESQFEKVANLSSRAAEKRAA